MGQPHRILLIEDDPAVARSLQDGLEREGYAVTWKASGAEGVEHARDHTPHLIILDVRLPGGSGFDFCGSMRQMGLRQPILMLTVRREEMDKVLGLEMGADDYVTKPYSLRELLSRIRALLRVPTVSYPPLTPTYSTLATWSLIGVGDRCGGAINCST